ncbi:glutathione S-transferase family protein [Rhizobium mesoamericanum]|uniref:Protein gstA n=1 Tax=Rhizobium mesoamericanum STM3625 TaxID=1211777 RepID=K0Q081_9HYPH|nr:glutathione S-transferase family protein [Rhizobium mesoamericanum]CCM77277.1 Protein gstA [Rhizobium mesoamericanum STM3625]
MLLYCHPLSGHSHRVRLFLSLINQRVELVEVDIRRGEQKKNEFLKMNRLGQVPVQSDGDVVLGDSNAILIYLAKKYRRADWLPDAQVQRWLSIAAGELAYGMAAARRTRLFSAKPVPGDVTSRSYALLKVLDSELEIRDWLTGKLTLADIALYAYVARASEGGIDLTDYPYVQAWLRRIESLPHFVPFFKTPPGLSAA